MLLLLGTVGLMGWFVKIKVVLKAFRVVATVVVVTCVVVVVVVVVVDVVVVVEGCSAACWRFVVLEINGAAVAGSKFGSGVSLPANRGSVLNSPENKKNENKKRHSGLDERSTLFHDKKKGRNSYL